MDLRKRWSKQKTKSFLFLFLRALSIFLLTNVAIIFTVFIGSTGYFGFHIEKEFIVLPLFYILPLILYIFFEEYHKEKKERVTVVYKKKPGILRALGDSFSSSDFWLSVLPLLFLLFFFDIGNVLILLCPKSLKRIFLIRTLFEFLLYFIPEAVLLLLAEGALRRDWYRCWKMNCFQTENGIAKIAPLPKGRGVFNVVITVFGGALIYILFLTLLELAFSMLSVILESVLLSCLLIIVLLLIPLLRWKSVYSSKLRFRKKAEFFAKERGFHFIWQAKTLKGWLACTRKSEFVLETQKEKIEGAFLPVHSKRAILYFGTANCYRYEKRFFWWWIFYPRHKFGFEETSSEKAIKKVLILTKENNNIRLGDEDISKPVFPADTVNGYVIHTSATFFNDLDRSGRLY